MARVSIGIPFLNSASTLMAAVRSVFAQSLRDWELILVDDGSSDGSLEIARRIKDPRVTVISDGVNRGLSYRLNQIASLARCEYLARMDADDLMHPDRIECQVAYLDAYPGTDVLGSAAYAMDQSGDVFGIREQPARPLSIREVISRGFFIHPTVIGRAVWFRANGYDPKYPRAEDHELWARTVRFSRFAVLNKPLLFYRDCPNGTKKYSASCRTDRKILQRYGSCEFGPLRTHLAIGKSYAKAGCYAMSAVLHLERFMLARRNRALSNAERESAVRALDMVKRTSLPLSN